MTGEMVLMVSGSAVLPIVNTQNLYYLHVKQLLKETGLFVLRLLIFKKNSSFDRYRIAYNVSYL